MKPTLRRLVVLGTPLILGILTMTHPSISDRVGIFHSVFPRVDWWITLHILLLPLFCLIALAVYLLIDDVHNGMATLSRVALGVFVIFYPALDGILGVGTGIIVLFGKSLPVIQQVTLERTLDMIWRSPIVNLIGDLGALGWVLGVLTAVTALSYPKKPPLFVRILVVEAVLFAVWSQLVFIEIPWLIGMLTLSLVFSLALKPHFTAGFLVLAAFLFGASHAPPFGPLGMACFFLAVFWLELLQLRIPKESSTIGHPLT